MGWLSFLNKQKLKEPAMKYLPFFLILTCFVSGCAHNINIAPNTSSINPTRKSEKIQGTAGYYITQSMREIEVITPAGGGDKVKYKPYDALEDGFVDVLKNVFTSIEALDSDIAPTINNNSVDYVVSLNIKTDSSSKSVFSWPPTWFGVSLTTEVFDTKREETISITAKGEGTATYSKFIRNRGVTGQEASLDALQNLQVALLDSQELNNSLPNQAKPKKKSQATDAQKSIRENKTVTERLKSIKELHENNLITDQEYEEKKAEIINVI